MSSPKSIRRGRLNAPSLLHSLRVHTTGLAFIDRKDCKYLSVYPQVVKKLQEVTVCANETDMGCLSSETLKRMSRHALGPTSLGSMEIFGLLAK